MKKYFVLVLAVLLTCSLLLPTVAMANTESGMITTVVYGDGEAGTDVGLTPDSPFYFLKLFLEQVRLTFTFSSDAKAERLMAMAELRLAELAALPEAEQALYAERLVKAFTKCIEKAEKHQAKHAARWHERVDLAVYNDEETVDTAIYHRSQFALHQAWLKAPEQAKPALERAMQVSQMGKLRSQAVHEAVYSPGPNIGNGQLKKEQIMTQVREKQPPGQAKKAGIQAEVEQNEVEETEDEDLETDGDPEDPPRETRGRPTRGR
jgi:hypothetical protein